MTKFSIHCGLLALMSVALTGCIIYAEPDVAPAIAYDQPAASINPPSQPVIPHHATGFNPPSQTVVPAHATGFNPPGQRIVPHHGKGFTPASQSLTPPAAKPVKPPASKPVKPAENQPLAPAIKPVAPHSSMQTPMPNTKTLNTTPANNIGN